jgi:hypothetical protein
MAAGGALVRSRLLTSIVGPWPTATIDATVGPLYPGAVAIRQTPRALAHRPARDRRRGARGAVDGVVERSSASLPAAGWLSSARRRARAAAVAIVTSRSLRGYPRRSPARTVERWLRGAADPARRRRRRGKRPGAAGVRALPPPRCCASSRSHDPPPAFTAIRPRRSAAGRLPCSARRGAEARPERRSLIVGEVGWGQVGIVTGLVASHARFGWARCSSSLSSPRSPL